MILFTSLTAIQAATAAAIAILLWFGTGRQPLYPVYRFLHTLISNRKTLVFLAATLAILAMNTYEVRMEQAYGVKYDLTSFLTGWEGHWHAALQKLAGNAPLTEICVLFYIVVFQSVMIASLGVYSMGESRKLFYAFCVSLLVNYAVALPMYWFVPVNEVWYARPDVKFLMLDAFPSFERDYRGLSGINNCFPSLHTSISVTMALLASRSGNRRWAAFTWVNAAIIVFSIFYLGIHWFTDAAAGVLLAVLSARVGLKAGAAADKPAAEPDKARTPVKTTSSSS